MVLTLESEKQQQNRIKAFYELMTNVPTLQKRYSVLYSMLFALVIRPQADSMNRENVIKVIKEWNFYENRQLCQTRNRDSAVFLYEPVSLSPLALLLLVSKARFQIRWIPTMVHKGDDTVVLRELNDLSSNTVD